MQIEQPETFEERVKVATTCVKELALTVPVLVDDLKNTVATAYSAMPDRIFILGTDAKIAYTGAKGPRGFNVQEMETKLAELLADD